MCTNLTRLHSKTKFEGDLLTGSPTDFLPNQPNMEQPEWEELSGELAESLRDNLSRKLANPNLQNDEELKALEPAAGFSWLEKTIRKVSAPYPSAVLQRAFRNPGTKQLVTHLRAKLHTIWLAPTQLTVGNPYRWWNLIAA